MRKRINLSVLFSAIFCFAISAQKQVLIFSKTEGFRHESIEIGMQTIKDLGDENHFEVVHTEDAAKFTDSFLDQFDLVIFLNTTGDILNDQQQVYFEEFIKQGSSFMGIHSAVDTEYEWPWYGKLVGAYFLNHPDQAHANILKMDTQHESCKHLPKVWTRFDEWYNYKSISPDITVLLTLDETTYSGGENGAHHPIAWYQEFDGGRMFYTGGGHTKEAYAEPDFRKHLLGGINYCLNN